MTDPNNKSATETGAAPGDDAANSKRSKMRYFKATDGKLIVFRGSPTRAYRSADFTTATSRQRGDYVAGAIRFSQHKAGGIVGGKFEAVEIGKVEFDTLMQAKVRRVKAAGLDLRFNSSPSDSWCTVDDVAKGGASC